MTVSKMEKVSSFTKKYSKETISKIKTFLKDNDVPNGLIRVRSVYFVDSDGPTKEKYFGCNIELPTKEKDKAAQLRKKLEQDPELGRLIEIECFVGAGEQFQPIENADRPEVGGEEDLTIEHKEGTVLLLDFWATWCGPCQGPMAHNQEMLHKNEEKWKDNVRIVGASLDQDRNQLNTRIKEKGWNKIDHYVLPGNWKHPGPQTYGCNGIPHVVLVNKVGKIVYTGHPSNVDLEQEINKLLAEEPTKTEEPKAKATEEEKAEKGVPVEIYKKLRNLFKEGRLKFLKELQEQKGTFKESTRLQHIKVINPDGKLIQVSRENLIAGVIMSSAAAETFTKALAAATEGIPEEYITKKLQVLELTKIEFGASCNACSKTLSNTDAQYWGYHDKKHFCKSCGDREDTSKSGVEKYVNPHALIYLHVKDPSSVAEAITDRIGDQVQPKTKEEEENLKVHEGYGCDACGEDVNDRKRFTCLSCLNIDLCGLCHEKIEAGDSGLAEKLKSQRHDVKTHTLQRYCFIEA